MSLLEKAINHQEQLAIESDIIQKAIYSCESGQKMTEASFHVVESKEMEDFFTSICIDNDRYQEISLTLLQYIGQMMQLDPENCIDNFIKKVSLTLQQSTNQEDIKYYKSIIKSIKDLGDSKEYKEYLVKYLLFQSDSSQQAIRAREIVKQKLESIIAIFN